MRVVVTGKGGTSGSWQIRGEQLGNAIGADVIPNASDSDMRSADVVVVVKRTPENIHKAQGVKVLDIVDAWTQPYSNTWSRDQMIKWARNASIPYDRTIAATQEMKEDTGADFFLRHHYRPDIKENDIRAKVQIIGYEGSMRYLEGWEKTIMRECEKRDWLFITNPRHLADCDVVLGLRGGKWRGYATDHWKSCVKMANAIGSLTPMIALDECGYRETGAPFLAVDNPDDLADAFDEMALLSTRMRHASAMREIKPYYALERVALDYMAWLQKLKS